MARTVGIGHQDFETVRVKNNFYIDKTDFIGEWWESDDEVTLITRPRRFGKTLTLSMVEKFFLLAILGGENYLRDYPFGRTKNTGVYRGAIRWFS